MHSPRNKAAALVAGGVLLASGAYGIGTQVDDGSATAANGSRGTARAPGDLANRLGVSEEKLRAAFEDLRGELKPPKAQRRAFAADLAKELGVEASAVRKALRKLRAKHEKEHAARREQLAEKLADKLGISVDKVKAALPSGPREGMRGPGPPGPGPGGPGMHGPPPGGPGF